jgi:hypothetical protein
VEIWVGVSSLIVLAQRRLAASRALVLGAGNIVGKRKFLLQCAHGIVSAPLMMILCCSPTLPMYSPYALAARMPCLAACITNPSACNFICSHKFQLVRFFRGYMLDA